MDNPNESPGRLARWNAASRSIDDTPLALSPGRALRNVLAARDVTAFVGVYDALSATLAGKHYDAIFVSGYGFAASHYGLPDIGFIAWPDMLALVQRLRGILPTHHILVDLDDGYGDPEIAAHVAAAMERAGASGVVLEDQQRPRRCGHAPGKQVLPLDQFLPKLTRVLEARREMLVVARTDAADDDERVRRAIAFAETGADAVLADGISDMGVLTRIARAVDKPVMFNQIAGGRSPRCTLAELRAAGVSMVNYSTPLLFAAVESMEHALKTLAANGGVLPDTKEPDRVGVADCTALLTQNLSRAEPVAIPEPTPIADVLATSAPTLDERIARLSPVKQRLFARRRAAVGPSIRRRLANADGSPLSRTQQWLWSAGRMDPAGISLNTTRGITLAGTLDVTRLNRAFSRAVERHEILRTTYVAHGTDESPRQHVSATSRVDLMVADLSGLSRVEQENAFMTDLAADARARFDLATGPVWRAWLTRFSPTDHRLAITVHHIAFDGWSEHLLLRELADGYSDADAAPPTLQYADFAAWQRSSEAPAASTADTAYWSRQLAGLVPLDLPTDRPRPPVMSTDGRRHTHRLAPATVDALKHVARANGATPFMVLLAGFKALLRDVTGRDEIVVGSHVAARDRVECESLIGPFINTLILRTQMGGVVTFADLLARVRGTTVDALAHAGVMFDDVVRLTNPKRDFGRNPLYDVGFQLRNFPRAKATTGDLTLSSFEADNGLAHGDLQVLADEQDGAIDLTFEYRTDLFDAGTIERLAARYARVLQAASADATVTLAQLAVASREPDIAAAAPLTSTQRTLAGIWSDVLNVDSIEAADDFFAIGGHSLRAVVCSAKVQETFGVELPVIEFFKTPTLAGLAASIDERLAAGPMSPPVARSDVPTRLSPGQARLWFLNRYESDGEAYNVPVARRLRGALDAARLERAFAAVVKRHEVLRTRYPDVEGVPIVEVVPAEIAAVAMPLTDLSHLPASERDAAAGAILSDEAGRRFDLGNLPLLRARLIRHAADDHTLLLTLHHIVCDEWSIRLLLDELSAVFRADADTLPPLRSQYGEFSKRQHARLESPATAVETAYWIRHLAGAPAVTALPTDRPRPATQSFRGAFVPIAMPLETAKKLRALGRDEHATDFMTTLALFYLLLTRWTGQRDLVVGTPVADRHRPEDQALIGYLLNTLPLCVGVSERESFRGLIARVREATLGALAHQSLPFEKIIEAIDAPRSLGHTPLFQTLFVLRTEGDGRLDLPGIESSPVAVRHDGAKFDLSMLLSETPDGIHGFLEYNTDLFDAETARRLADRYVELAEVVTADADVPIESFCVADADERQAILQRFNRPVAATGGTVLDLWDEQVKRTPDAAAVVFGDESLTYAQLDARANALAGELVRRGVRDEDRIGLYLHRSTNTMAALLGVLKAGAAYVPLDPTYPAERLAMMLDDAGSTLVLSESKLAGQAMLAGRQVMVLDRDWPSATNVALPRVRADQLAYVLYTSGSTGRPKGVAMSHGPAWHLARWQRANSDCNAGTRTLQFTSLNFDVSFQEIFSTLCGGGTLVLVDDLTRRDPDALLRHVVDQRVHRLFLPFVALQSLADAATKPSAPRAALREVMTAGEQLRVTPSVAQWFASMPGTRLFNQYGPTETHVINSSLELAGDPRGWPALPSIGRPIEDSRLYVLDDAGRLLPVGAPGNLHIGGACLARGYLNRPDLTDAAFVPDPFSDESGARMYKTGDLARWNADGTVQYLGRGDGQVKVQGYRVEPGEIEAALSKYPGVRQAAVVARDDAGGVKRLIAYVVTDALPDVKDLRRRLARTLPAYMVPSAFVRLAAMPLTGSNKIDRAALPDPTDHGAEPAPHGRPAATDTQRALLDLWCKTLDHPITSIDDNFFDVGGHSLLAIKLFSRIEKRFGRALPVSALFSSPTVAQLTTLIDDSAPAANDGVVIPLQPHGDRPPLFCLAGINGHVFSYRTLAGLMGEDQPVYGLQVEGLETDRAALDRVETIAAYLLTHVRRVQPRGPYALIGYSFGGTVAYEMARQLRAAGETVRLLALIDTFATSSLARKSLPRRAAVHAKRLATAGPANAIRYLRGRGRRILSAPASPTLAVAPSDASATVTQAIYRVRLASDRALRVYRPLPYDGAITLLRASVRPAWHDFVIDEWHNGWQPLASRVDVHAIAGAHLTLLENEGAADIAAVLRDKICGVGGHTMK